MIIFWRRDVKWGTVYVVSNMVAYVSIMAAD